MSLLPNDEADLLRLKTQMEIIRTICPIIMMILQMVIIVELYQMFHVELTNDNDSQPANENHYHRPNENHYHRPNENHYHLGKSARPRQSEKSMRKRAVYAEICDQLGEVQSVFFKDEEQLFRRHRASAVSMRFRLSCSRQLQCVADRLSSLFYNFVQLFKTVQSLLVTLYLDKARAGVL